MKKNNLLHIFNIYRRLIEDAGVAPQVVDISKHLTRDEMLGHCRLILEEKIEPLLHRIGGFQEAVRLLGCIQGTVMACGLCTIAETREHLAVLKMTAWEQILD